MLRLLVLLAIILALTVGVASQPATAQEEIDLSGEWTMESGTPFTEAGCPMIFAQVGTRLAAVVECLAWHFSGEIDPATGEFTLSSIRGFLQTDFEGTASNDALSMTSVGDTFPDPIEVEGTRKNDPGERRNISGDWQSFLSGFEELERCATSVWHRGEELEIALECGSAADGSFTGTINMETGSFSLSGTLFGEDGKLAGVASRSGRLVAAVWSVPSLGSGTLTSYLEMRTGGVVAIDCDGATEGIQEDCIYDTGDTFIVQLHITEAPPDGYNGFELAVSWTVPQLAYRPSDEVEDEFLEQGCATAERGNQWMRRVGPEPVVVYICLNPPGSDIRLSAGVPIELEVTCWAEGTSTLSLAEYNPAVLWIRGTDTVPIDKFRPLTRDASVTCLPKSGQLGDIDCSGAVDSIDAALLLQFHARLIEPLGCDYKGDMTQDGRLDSRDATLILQRVAGLLP